MYVYTIKGDEYRLVARAVLLGGLCIFGGLDFFPECLDLTLGLGDGILLGVDLVLEVAHLFVKCLGRSTLERGRGSI